MHSDNQSEPTPSVPPKLADSPSFKFQLDGKTLNLEQYAHHATKRIQDLQNQIKKLQDELSQYRKDKPDRTEIIASVKKELRRLQSVNSAYYVPIETKDLRIIVICDSGREVEALDAVIEKISTVEDEFPDVDFRPVVLSTDQVGPDTLTGAHRAF